MLNSETDSYCKHLQINENEELIIYMNSWDDKVLKVIFSNIIQFHYEPGSDIKDLYEIEGEFINNIIMKYYKCIPTHRHFKFFQIEDIDIVKDINQSECSNRINVQISAYRGEVTYLSKRNLAK